MRNKIIELRMNGFSLKAISKTLGCSKSTVSKHIKGLRENNKQVVSQVAATAAAKEKWIKHNKEVYDKAASEWPRIKRNTKMMNLICIYWTEGTKRQRDFKITNSDPGLIKIALMALKEYGIDKFSLSLCVYPENNIENCKKVWFDSLGIRVNNIFIKEWRSKKKQLFSKYGVCYLRVISGTDLWYKMKFWIKMWQKELGVPTDSQLGGNLGTWQSG